jgi:hypothetical protein
MWSDIIFKANHNLVKTYGYRYEISNLGLEHINKIYYIEGDCLFDIVAHL